MYLSLDLWKSGVVISFLLYLIII